MKTANHGGMPSPKVAVGWLTDGTWRAAFGMSLMRLMLHELVRTGRPLLPMEMKFASGGLVEGRNELARRFLDDTTCEWLLLVDVDMGFPGDALEQLLAAASPERPVVGGLCFAVRRDGMNDTTFAEGRVCLPTVYVWREFPDRAGFQVVEDYERDALLEVSATGAAFLLVHRSALEKIRDAENLRAAANAQVMHPGRDLVPEQWFDRIQHTIHDEAGKVVFHTTFSEDLSFCIRVAGADLPVFVHTGVKTCHDKGGRFYDESEWDAQLERLRVPASV